MPRNDRRNPEEAQVQQQAEAILRMEAALEERILLLSDLRAAAPAHGAAIDRVLLAEAARLREGLEETRGHIEEAKALIAKLGAPAWFPALFLRLDRSPDGPFAKVQLGGHMRVVGIGPNVPAASLVPGEEVYLGPEQNVLIRRADQPPAKVGETAEVVRVLDGDRVLVRHQGREDVVLLVPSLREAGLAADDLVLCDYTARLCLEKLPRPDGRRFALEEVEDIGRDAVGGLERVLDEIELLMTGILRHPDKALRYGLRFGNGILLVGPPGCGKTLLTRTAVAALKRAASRRCFISVVKPSEWADPFVGVTERNIRECFRALREAAADGAFCVLFLDEVESVGRIRGHQFGHHDDKALNALLAEIDGFKSLKNCVIVAATNRPDLVDPGLLSRLGQREIEIPRPNRQAAREIFGIHLPETLLFGPDGKPGETSRREILDAAVARLYSPNGDNAVATIKYRDGGQRALTVRDLVSGRMISQICARTCHHAFAADVRQGRVGIAVEDMEAALDEVLASLTTLLTPANVRAHVSGLPQDRDIVAVEPAGRKVARPSLYLRPAHA